jgi:hypothetical protein
MTEPDDPAAQQVEVDSDGAELSVAEELDEDELRTDPLEKGMDPPEHWSGVDRWGTTPREEREGEPLDQRLAEEVPDIQPDVPDQ